MYRQISGILEACFTLFAMSFALTLTTANVGLADLSDGLVAWYPFNGDAVDDSGNGNNGTVIGPTLADDRFGNLNSAYSFDGVNDYINIGNNVKPPLPFTVSTWIKVETIDNRCVFRNDRYNNASNRNGVALMVYSDGTVAAHVFEGFSASWNRQSKISSDSVITVGSWHHFAVVFNAHNDMQLFWDGEEIDGYYREDGTGSGLSYSTADGAIGLYYQNIGGAGAAKYFHGCIDDICVYGRSLSAAEIAELYNFGPFPPNGNEPPVVDVAQSMTCHKNVQVNLIAAFLDDPTDIHIAWWDFGDGTPVQDGEVVYLGGGSGEAHGNHVYDLPGVYTAWVCVEDDKGESACDDIIITVIANQPPVAQCQDVTVDPGPDCEAAASIDAGSSDPDGDSITIVQDPAGPYPVGQTVVTLIVTDDSGASDSCTATVTVVDTWPPEVICQDVTVTAGPGGLADADVDDGSYDTCGDLFGLVQTPSGPYPLGVTEVTLTATDLSGNTASCLAVVTVLPQVVIDIKPTNCPNPLNVASRGVLPVAILGTEGFDVSMVDPESIRLTGVAPLRWSFEDVCTLSGPLLDNESEFGCTEEGPDGLMDMALKFDDQEIAEALEFISGPLTDGQEILVGLTGSLLPEFGGTPIEGKDVVRIIKKVE